MRLALCGGAETSSGRDGREEDHGGGASENLKTSTTFPVPFELILDEEAWSEPPITQGRSFMRTVRDSIIERGRSFRTRKGALEIGRAHV